MRVRLRGRDHRTCVVRLRTGVQNTGLNPVTAITPVAPEAVIGTVGFLLATVAPIAAVAVTPVHQERRAD
jgi:hypothetical protein